jgi:membrane protein DedA with SNARE-associated domain
LLTAVAAAVSGGQQPVLPGFLNSLSSPLSHYGLWAVALLVLVEDFGIPLPGETVLIAASIYAGSGRLNVVAVGLVGFASAVVGDNIGYAIGRFGGRALVERWGKYVFITPERLDKAEDFFGRHGGKIITIARFIEGLREANGLIAGITHMHWLKFFAYNALGAALWVGTWVSVGYFAGQHITPIYNAITRYSLYAAIAAVVLIAAWVLLRVRKRRRAKTATEAQAEATATASARDTGTDQAATAAFAGEAAHEAATDKAPGTGENAGEAADRAPAAGVSARNDAREAAATDVNAREAAPEAAAPDVNAREAAPEAAATDVNAREAATPKAAATDENAGSAEQAGSGADAGAQAEVGRAQDSDKS